MHFARPVSQTNPCCLRPGSGISLWCGCCKAVGHMKLVTILLALFLPPVAVFLAKGLGKTFWLNVLLTLLGGIPGVIHALIVVL